MGHRSPCGTCPTARNQSNLETVEARYATDVAEPMAAGGVREDEASVRCRQENPQLGAHLRDCVRDRRWSRRRIDLPLHLRGYGLREAGPPFVDLFAHAGRHSSRVRKLEAWSGLRFACGRRPWAQPGRLARWHESVAG